MKKYVSIFLLRRQNLWSSHRLSRHCQKASWIYQRIEAVEDDNDDDEEYVRPNVQVEDQEAYM